MKHVLFKRPCKVCGKEIEFLKDFNYIDPDGVCRAYKSEDGAIMCDYADDRGCFLTYHEDCFDKHSCGVHTPKLKPA